MMVSSVRIKQYNTSHDSLLDVNYYFISQQREPDAGDRGGVMIDG